MIVAICSLMGLCLLLNLLMLHFTHGITACEPGWFGTSCQFQCLCTGSNCDSAGQCMAGSKCKPGYFGPACQYGDIVQLTALSSDALVWLTDGDDATCSSDPHLQSVALRFNQGLSFTWFRICVSYSDALNRFDIKLNNDVSCLNMKNATVGDTSMDVYCSVDTAVRSLTLSGSGVPFLCSIYISLANDEHFSGISLKMFGTSGQLVHYFVANNDAHYLHIPRTQPVSRMSISARPHELLKLCELFVFGETVCPDGTFGLDCGSYCNCTDRQQTCLTSTGKCAAACTNGFYGLSCSVPCPDACGNGVCTPRHGDCIGELRPASVHRRSAPKKGTSNTTTNAGCRAGYYGPGCMKPCAKKCDQKCNQDTGECMKCPPGHHGVNCSQKCDVLCFNDMCEADSGFCHECSLDRWGNFCEHPCGEKCYLQECNSTTGRCFSCAAGYKGTSCVKVPWNVTLFIVLLFLIPSVIACFFCCEVLSDEDAEDDLDKDSMATEMSVQPSMSGL